MQWTISFKKNSKIFKKKSFQKIVVFSNIFLPIFHYIGLYIYTVKYPVFSEIFLKNLKHFKKEKNICFAYSQILKFFQAYFSLKKQNLHLFHVFF